MSTHDSNALVFPASIDLHGLDANLTTAEGLVGDFADRAADRLSHIRPPSVAVDLGSTGGGGAAGDAAASLGPRAAQMAAALANIGPGIAGSISASLRSAFAGLEGQLGGIARTISRQMHDAFSFAQVQDGIKSTKDIFENKLAKMRRALEAYSESGRASNAALFDAMKAQITEVQFKYDKFLLHSASNFKKGGLPTLDTFFVKQSRVYKGGAPAGGGGPSVDVNPIRAASAILPRAVGGMRALGSVTGVASKAARGLGFALTGALGPIGLVFAAQAAVAGFFKTGIKGASDLNETVSKTDVVLGSASGQVKKFADEMAEKFGLVKGQTLDTAASFAGLGKSLGGLKGDKLGAMSTQFTKLAADLSSFSNIGLEEASQAISTGLAGNQSDTLRELGVILSENNLKSYAYAHGIAKVGEELNEQQKFAARSALITRGLAKASGDLERTQGGAANQGRKLWGTISNLGTAVGSVLLPVVTEGITLLNEFGGWAMKSFGESGNAVESWKETFLSAFDWVIATVHNLPAAFEVARLAILEKLVNIGEYFAVLGPNVVTIAGYIGRNWLLLIGDAFDATLTSLKNLWTNFEAIGAAIGAWFKNPTQGFKFEWTPLLDGFRATAEQFPELLRPVLTDMGAQIGDAASPIADEVASRRAARALANPAAAKALGDPEVDKGLAKEKKGPKEKTLGGALELGSKEAYSSIANATAAQPKGIDRLAKSGDETARNTRIMADHLARFNNPPKPRNVRKLVIP